MATETDKGKEEMLDKAVGIMRANEDFKMIKLEFHPDGCIKIERFKMDKPK